ncbi:thioester reductase domain-containing protein [Streptomyces sp. NPDC000594]|uniref:non-ribosomal peptide synthetase n=1 Tax=Streptomyces sp. NPDC000594 TaxID=3154261 RepID=UPI003320D9E2
MTRDPGLPEPLASHPMSHEQESIWLNDTLGDGVSRYVENWVHRLYGPVDPAAVEAALTALVHRHEALRSRLRLNGTEPRQEVLPPLPVPLERRRTTARELDTEIRAAVRVPLPLDRPPLLRATLVDPVDLPETVLAVAVHHAVVDGWSLHLLEEEFSALYREAVGRPGPALPPVPLQPGPLARLRRTGPDPREESAAHWKETLAGAPPESTFPLDRPRPRTLGHRGDTVPLALGARTTERLHACCRELKATPFTLLAAALTALLARHGDQRDIVIGTPVSRRDSADTLAMIACLAEVLPLRTRVEPEHTFRELVDGLRDTVRGVREHRDMPLTGLLRAAGAPRTRSRSPLFQVVLTLDDGPAPGLSLPGIRAERLRPHNGTAKFDVLVHLHPSDGPSSDGNPSERHLPGGQLADGGLSGTLEYATDLFDRATAQSLADRFRRLVDSAVTFPDTPVAELTALTPEDRHRATVTWAHGADPGPGEPLAPEAFRRAARRTPDAVAVEHGAERLSYAQVDAASDAVAERLTATGHARAAVAVVLERSIELPVAVLGVLKAGGCCVPLDPRLPPERLALQLRDSGARAVLADRGTSRRCVGVVPGADILLVDEIHPAREPLGRPAQAALESGTPDSGALQPERGVRGSGSPVTGDGGTGDTDSTGSPAGAPGTARTEAGTARTTAGTTPADPAGPGPEDPAYLVYTSGSTGRPKGVLMPHRGLATVIGWQLQRSGGTPRRTAQFATTGFDVSFQELFATWAAGGTLVVVDDTARRDPAPLCALLAAHRVERLFLPCVALQQIAEYAVATGARIPTLREVVSAGEQLYVTPAVRRFFADHPGAVLDNQYGPSETHVVTAGALTGDPAHWPERPDIGRPVPGATVRILDARLAPVPPGAVGEICAGGRSLALGYHRLPEITRQRFVPDPGDGGGALLYRTGDRGRHLPDGRIVFVGRDDDQVKVRGHRVEPGEVEAALKSVPGIADAAVTADVPPDRRVRLIAHYVPSGEGAPDAERLRRALRERLPEPLVPAVLVPLAGLPLTPTGKVDRAALTVPREPEPRTAAAPLRTATEHRMAQLWAEVLGCGRVGAEEDLFALGGDSLLLARLLLRMDREWGVRLSPAAFDASPTVRALAALVDAAGEPAPAAGAAADRAADLTADARLDPAITPAPVVLPVVTDPGEVLLTGATGFLGTFLLSELLRTTDATVHCLVRAPHRGAGADRLRAALDGYGLWDETFTERIQAVPGDLALPGLGLSADAFDTLARRAEAVFHAGAEVHLTRPYALLRAANVRGTEEVLRLAARHRSVPLHHISTVGVFTGVADGSTAVREDAPLPPGETVPGGYARSKWAAEVLLEQAGERGLPVSVHRPSRISGAGDSGLCQTSDYLWLLLKGCVEAGLAPAAPGEGFDLIPVDALARAVLALSRNPGATGGTFHLAAGEPTPLGWMVARLREAGYAIEEVAPVEWRRAIEADPANTAFPLLPLIKAADPEGGSGDGGAGGENGLFDTAATRTALRGSGAGLPRVDAPLFARYVESFVRRGFLPPPPGRSG